MPDAASNVELLHGCLARFLVHVDGDEVALTGSAAIQLELGQHGAAIGDLDFVASRIDAVFPSITRDFLINHFHLPQRAYPKFMLQIVDPNARVKVDVFPDSLSAIVRAHRREVAGRSVQVLDARDILRHKLRTLRNSRPDHLVDLKHQHHALMLAEFLQEGIQPVPSAHLTTDVYERHLKPCARCQRSLNIEFPLAPKPRILEILGYT
jgi:hypothetical protein